LRDIKNGIPGEFRAMLFVWRGMCAAHFTIRLRANNENQATIVPAYKLINGGTRFS